MHELGHAMGMVHLNYEQPVLLPIDRTFMRLGGQIARGGRDGLPRQTSEVPSNHCLKI